MVTGHVGRRSVTKGSNEIILDFGRTAAGKRDRRTRRLRRPNGDDGRLRPFTAEEAREALRAAGEMAGFIARMDGRRDQTAVVLSGTLGLRRHEALALRWSDIDWDAGEIQISRGIIELPGRPPALDDLKTATSRR